MSENIIFSDEELETLRNGQFLYDEESNGDDFPPEDKEPQAPAR
jgi:hypothetical protein